PVVTIAPPAARGLPPPVVTRDVASPSAATLAGALPASLLERGGNWPGGDVPVRDEPGARESAGRLHLFVDPLVAFGAQEPQSPDGSPPQRQEPLESRWSDFLPVGREAVLAAGYELPRAFGFGVAYTR